MGGGRARGPSSAHPAAQRPGGGASAVTGSTGQPGRPHTTARRCGGGGRARAAAGAGKAANKASATQTIGQVRRATGGRQITAGAARSTVAKVSQPGTALKTPAALSAENPR